MRGRRLRLGFVLALVSAAFVAAPAPAPAVAASPLKRVCGAAGLASGAVGKACNAVNNGGGWVKAGKKLLGGHVGGAAKAALNTGAGKVVSAAGGAVALAAMLTWVLGGAKFALHETGLLLGATTSPQLDSTWFSSTYWRVAGISVLLTLPFLFAAAIQALLRSDLALLVRAAFGYLPLAMLAVSIVAPVTMLLLAASDQLSAIVSSATGNASNRFISLSTGVLGELTVATGPFVAFLVGLFIVAGAFVLWIELLMREAAVYVIVLMLPLAFAAMVWPARRIWAIRAVELLAALVMSKFAIVAVLSLGGAALSSGASVAGHSLTAALAGVVLLIMGAFAPWALLRLLPLAEVAATAAGSLGSDTRARAKAGADLADGLAYGAAGWAATTVASMNKDALEVPSWPPAGDASGTTPWPPPAGEGLGESSGRARPQGGPGVATRSVEEAPEAEGSAEPEPAYGDSDLGIDEMCEHPGEWELST